MNEWNLYLFSKRINKEFSENVFKKKPIVRQFLGKGGINLKRESNWNDKNFRITKFAKITELKLIFFPSFKRETNT